jgi:hypothetical protein
VDEIRSTLHRVADVIADYREGLPTARVGPVATRDDVRRTLEIRVSVSNWSTTESDVDLCIDAIARARADVLRGAPRQV